MTAPPAEGTVSLTGENHLFEEKTTGFHNNISESLEERAWILGQEDPPNLCYDAGSLSKRGRNVSDEEPHRWGESGTQNGSIAAHEDIDVDLYTIQTCHHSDDLPALHGKTNSGKGCVSLLAIPSKLEHSIADPYACYLEGAGGLDNSQMPVSTMEHERKRLGSALSVPVASDSHAGRHCTSRSLVESATGKDPCDLLRLICTNRASHLASRDASFCSTGQFGKLSKMTLPVVMGGSKYPYNVGFADEFPKHQVVLALNRRARQIEVELEKRSRRSLTTLAKMN